MSTHRGGADTLEKEAIEPIIEERMPGNPRGQLGPADHRRVERYPGVQIVRNPEIPQDAYPAFRFFFLRSAF